MKEDLDRLREMLNGIEELSEASEELTGLGTVLRQALADIASSVSAVAQAQERPPVWLAELVLAIRSLKEEGEDEAEDDKEESAPSWVPGLLAAIRSVQIVNNVQPAEVTLPPQQLPAAQMPLMPSGVRMRVVKRDDLGRLSELVFIPEN